MKMRARRTTKAVPTFIAAFVFTAFAVEAVASHPVDSAAIIACGKLESFLGTVQIFDATRSQVIDTTVGRKIQCGDWVSVEDGKAIIRHAKGFRIHVSRNSFVQILDPQAGENTDHDHVALFRGELEIQAAKGTGVSVATANGRARFSGSRGIVRFNSNLHETQLVGIRGSSTLVNRYLSQSPVTVKSGRVSEVQPNESRLQPSRPRGANLKQLTELLARFGVDAETKDSTLAAAKAAQSAPLPAKLATKKQVSSSRAPASVHGARVEPGAFTPVQGSALPVGNPSANRLTEQYVKPSVTAGAPLKAKRAPSAVREPDWTSKPKGENLEKERKKVLEKLSGLGPESSDSEE